MTGWNKEPSVKQDLIQISDKGKFFILLLSGLAMFSLSFNEYLKTSEMIAKSHQAEGKVIELVEPEDTSSGGMAPVISFTDQDNNRHKITGPFTDPPLYKVHDVVTLLYAPDTPENAVIENFRNLWMPAASLAVFGSILFYGTFYLGSRILRAKQRNAENS